MAVVAGMVVLGLAASVLLNPIDQAELYEHTPP
jgi:hypothetical protein